MKFRYVAGMLAVLCLYAGPIPADGPAATWTLGVLAHRGEAFSERRWAPTAAYLSEQLSADVRLRSCSLPEMAEALARGELDFVLTNPGHYVELEFSQGASRVATLKKLREGNPYTVFGAVIFTRADRTDIRTLEDLAGKRFGAVAKDAFGGFQMAWRELLAAGVDPFQDLDHLAFTGFPQDDIVLRVKNGELDAGTVRTGILEQMAREGQIDAADFHILDPRSSAGFPFRHSTRLYPEWAFAKARMTSEEVARAVAVALLQMPADHPAALAGKYAGWTVPLDYEPVHDLFRELGIGPYRRAPMWMLTRLVREYWYLLVLVGVTILFAAFHVIHVERLVVQRTRELMRSKQDLESEIDERERIEQQTRTLLQEKRFLARKCMAVQEDERRHLARELHDELGQCITAIQADAETIQELSHERDQRLTASAQAIQAVASRLYGVVHSMMERLRPSALDQLGLADTLREEVKGWQQRCPQTRYTLQVDGRLDLPDEGLNISLYRIVQECLTNIARHADARQVRLRVQRVHGDGDDRVELDIEDDGVGMDPASPGPGLGLIGMRERVEALGGRFELAAARGRGVRHPDVDSRAPWGSAGGGIGMMGRISVLLCDDHEVVRAGYQRLFETTGDIAVIAEAADGEEACRQYREHRPDVAVMDLTMPGIGGLEAGRRILCHHPDARILVFSVHENEIMLNRALDAGVLGYISKRSASRVIVEAVRRVATGRPYIGEEMLPHLERQTARGEPMALASLSTREFEVFRLLVDSASVNDIAAILAISPKTAGHHVTSIKSKLGIQDVAGLTRLAIRHGIISP